MKEMTIDVLMIYPRLGSMDSFVKDLPLSILYASAEAVKRNYSVEACDFRLITDWKSKLAETLDKGVRLVGVSVMTGTPMKYAREISLFVRKHAPDTKIVWGGPHVTVVPDTIEQSFIDFLIRGYGSIALADLIVALKNGQMKFENIPGISWKKNGEVKHNQRLPAHELLAYQDIPYQLLDINDPQYVRSYNGQRLFSMFSAIGCPYKCNFCMHPAVYKIINGPKWLAYPTEDIIDHIKMVHRKYQVTGICFIDDTSFVDLARMRELLKRITKLDFKIVLEFRGARVNELDKMDDSFLQLMVDAGTRVVMVGFESASNRILKIMKKGITKEQIFRVNQKLARFSEIRPIYNFFCGTPGETYDDLLETKDAILQIIKDNPVAHIGFGADWKPIPGTKMVELAEKDYNFKPPVTFDEWMELDSFDSSSKIQHSWYSTKHDNLIKILQVSASVIDNKILDEFTARRNLSNVLLRLGAKLYYPLAMFRLKNNFFSLPVEYPLYRLAFRLLSSGK